MFCGHLLCCSPTPSSSVIQRPGCKAARQGSRRHVMLRTWQSLLPGLRSSVQLGLAGAPHTHTLATLATLAPRVCSTHTRAHAGHAAVEASSAGHGCTRRSTHARARTTHARARQPHSDVHEGMLPGYTAFTRSRPPPHTAASWHDIFAGKFRRAVGKKKKKTVVASGNSLPSTAGANTVFSPAPLLPQAASPVQRVIGMTITLPHR